MRLMGFVLLVIGALALIYGGIRYNRERTVIDLGPIRAIATEQRTIPFSPIFGGIALLGGALLLLLPRRRLAS